MSQAGDACPNCVIGRMQQRRRIEAAAPMQDTLVYLQEIGLRCSVCGHEDFQVLTRGGQAAALIFGARCDFCGDEDVVEMFECTDFVLGQEEYVGGWGACVTCRDLIRANDREGLVSHAISRFCVHHPKHVGAMVKRGDLPGRHIRATQAGFFRHRKTSPPPPEAPLG